eukprot:1351357-Rhodomonas_salina.1
MSGEMALSRVPRVPRVPGYPGTGYSRTPPLGSPACSGVPPGYPGTPGTVMYACPEPEYPLTEAAS